MKYIVLSVLLVCAVGFVYVTALSPSEQAPVTSKFPEAAPRDPEENISGEVDVPLPEDNFIEETSSQSRE